MCDRKIERQQCRNRNGASKSFSNANVVSKCWMKWQKREEIETWTSCPSPIERERDVKIGRIIIFRLEAEGEGELGPRSTRSAKAKLSVSQRCYSNCSTTEKSKAFACLDFLVSFWGSPVLSREISSRFYAAAVWVLFF